MISGNIYTTDDVYRAAYRAGLELHDIFNLVRILADSAPDSSPGFQPEVTLVHSGHYMPDNPVALLRRICDNEGTDYAEVIGPDRSQGLVRVRTAFCAIAHDVWGELLTEKMIGRAIHRDRSTVIHHIQVCRTEPWRRAQYLSIKRKLNLAH